MELDRGSFLERERKEIQPDGHTLLKAPLTSATTPKAPKAKPGQVCHWNGGRWGCRRAFRLAHPSSLT